MAIIGIGQSYALQLADIGYNYNAKRFDNKARILVGSIIETIMPMQ